MLRTISVKLAAAGYGPAGYWFNLPFDELMEWLEVIGEIKEAPRAGA